MSLGTVLLIVLVLMLIGVIPTRPHSKVGAMGRAERWACRCRSDRPAGAGKDMTCPTESSQANRG
jgi:hypothetical protein